ncbi:integrator complex subunit [Nesidiocoris tenuis]|uniref:Integrator complex subunit n=2 Tax=Nesidiocoris tenuis TaxID=355587 RepID=A0ABN7AQR8_9HEMI|nr:integrator complex subunit [Nesidiocoris tenuis]
MTIIVFLIDTSASMNQRAYLGGRPTLLDVAKGAVETFVKVRQRSLESRGDRYMLLTFEEPPHNIKAAWKENLATFMNELKNLQCQGMTQMGAALKHAFDVLNINRMQTGIDTYGHGRCPFFLEPSVIVVITDGGKLSNNTGVQEEFNLPMHSPIPGCELTREPFRWDQRLFSLVLRLSGTPAVERDVGLVPSDSSPIDAMCEVTGGRSYSVTSHRMLMQCIDSLVQKVQSGVVINFEKIGPDPPPVNNEGSKENTDDSDEGKDWDKDGTNSDGGNKAPNGTRSNNNNNSNNNSNSTAWQTCRKLIYVPRSAQKGYAVGFWPIPESFWPDLQSQTLPPRSAHPNVKFTCTSQDPMVIDNLPFDKYELEPSPLTQYILARKQPTVCWQVFVPNSYKNPDVAHPFGYLKASTNLSCVNLFVMPYNYPVLLPLLDELFKVHRQKMPPEWRTNFSNYLRTMPAYYAGPLRRALTRMGAAGGVTQTLVPEAMDNTLSYSVLNYLKRLKNSAKVEYEKLCNEVSGKQMTNKVNQGPEGVRVTPRSPMKRDLLSHSMLQDKFQSLRDQLNEFGGFVVGVGHRKHRASQSYRNAFDIPRNNLLDQILRMRANFLNPSPSHTKLQDDDVVHSMPISQMGNYQEYLKKTQPQLREVESAPVRQHMFGNPFKIDKRMMVDEADIDLVGGPSSLGRGQKRTLDGTNPSRPNKRKPGPIPRDVTIQRPLTPASPLGPLSPSSPLRPLSPSPPASPTPLQLILDESPPASPTPATSAAPPALPAASTAPSTVFKSIPRVTPPVFVPQPPVVAFPPLMQAAPPVLVVSPPASPAPVVAPAPPVLRCPSPPPLLNGDISGDVMVIDDESDEPAPISRSPSPPLDGGEFAPPPVLQPYDGAGVPPIGIMGLGIGGLGGGGLGVGGGSTCPRLAPSYSVTPPLSPPPLIAAPAPPSPPQEPTKKELDDIKRHNLTVRAMAYKEVRRAGLDYDRLFNHLATMKGTQDQQIALLKDVINESLRFKRRKLASHLDRKLKTLNCNSSSGTINCHRGHNGSR